MDNRIEIEKERIIDYWILLISIENLGFLFLIILMYMEKN